MLPFDFFNNLASNNGMSCLSMSFLKASSCIRISFLHSKKFLFNFFISFFFFTNSGILTEPPSHNLFLYYPHQTNTYINELVDGLTLTNKIKLITARSNGQWVLTHAPVNKHKNFPSVENQTKCYILTVLLFNNAISDIMQWSLWSKF